jgi:hypothetical protein
MNKISDHLEVYSRPEKVSGFACNTLYVCMYVLGPYAASSNHCGHLHRSRGVMVCRIGCGGEGGRWVLEGCVMCGQVSGEGGCGVQG